VVTAAPVVSAVGYYRLIHASFVLKIAMGLTLFLIGQGHPWMLAAFFLIERFQTYVHIFCDL